MVESASETAQSQPVAARARNGAAAALAAAVTVGSIELAAYPLETIKTRKQSLQRSADAMPPTHQQATTWTSSYSAHDNKPRIRAITSLYKGVSLASATACICAGTFFGVYESSFDALGHINNVHVQAALSATLAEVVVGVIRTPSEVIQQHLQVQKYDGAAKAALALWQTRGLAALFPKVHIMAFRLVPFSAIKLMTYERLKIIFPIRKGIVRDSCCGALAATSASVLTAPLETIKTRVFLHQVPSGSLLNAVWTTIRADGIASLFRGARERAAAMAFGAALFFPGYECLKGAFAGWLD